MRYKHDLSSGSAEVKIDPSIQQELSRAEAKEVRSLLSTLAMRVAVPQGAPADFTREDIAGSFKELRPVADQILSRLSHKDWPPYRRPSPALTFLKKHFEGNAAQLRGIAKTLVTEQRRPSARSLCVRILANWTGLTRDQVRRLIRD